MSDGDCDKRMKKGTEDGELVENDGGGGDDFQISLPIELILEFLSRIPIKSLRRLSCTSKYLYNTINQDPHFCRSHFINFSQKNPSLVLNVINTDNKLYKNLFYSRDLHNDDNQDVDVRLTIPYTPKGNFWGYCNGLVCFAKICNQTFFIVDVWNFTTKELLRIIPPIIIYKEDISSRNTLLSHGFGFDSINNEYKLVLAVFKLKTGCCQSLVYTFGTKSSWKQVNLPDQKPTSTFTPYGASKFVTFGGGGAFFWRTTDPRVILQFDLHQDKFQYIQIPLESNEFPASNNHIRLFESKGFLCVAILIQSKSTTSLEKVHLKIYRDNQVWVKETFDIALYSLPSSSNFRFTSFSDQVLMYWMDSNCFQFFNLHSKCLKVVRKLTSCNWDMGLPQCARADDYWLICEVQNISSLTTLLPERAQKCDEACLKTMMTKDINDMCLSREPKTCRGILMSLDPRKTTQHYYFFNDK